MNGSHAFEITRKSRLHVITDQKNEINYSIDRLFNVFFRISFWLSIQYYLGSSFFLIYLNLISIIKCISYNREKEKMK